MTTIHEPDVDALDPDAPAAAQLDIDAQRAGFSEHMRIVRPNGGPTTIAFDSRRDFLEVVAFGLIHADPNPYHTKPDFAAGVVRVPVTFGWPYAWNAEATYPTQEPERVDHACTCKAELVHMSGCPADEIAVVVDIPREACSYCGGFVGAHKPGCTFGRLPHPIPGAAIVHELLPNEYDGFGGLTCDAPFTGSEPATTVAADVTCPDCLRYIKPPSPLAVQAREHAERRTALVPPMTRFLRDAYSDVRAAEARELASEVRGG